MIRLLKNILVFSLAFIAIAGILPGFSYADYGATIEAANCDPAADPALDYLKTNTDSDNSSVYPTKSCVGQNISMQDASHPYKVKISFVPDAAFIGAYVSENLAALMVVYGAVYWAAHSSAFSAAMAACDSLCAPAAEVAGQYAGYGALVGAVTAAITSAINAAGDNVQYISVGDSKNLISGGPLGPVARVEVSVSGDKVCSNLVSLPLPFLNFKAERTSSFNSSYGIQADSPLPTNCVYAPPPVAVSKPPVPSFISRACIDYDSTASQFRWPASVPGAGGSLLNGKTRSFMGVVVQCVQDTMMNLFFNVHSGSTISVFVKTQQQLSSMIRAMLALYVIMIGYKYVIGEKSGTKRNEFVWMGLRVALVLGFASGTTMTYLLPNIINSIQNISAIIIDASAGTTADKTTTKAALSAAESDYNTKRATYTTDRIRWAQYTPATYGYTDAQKQILQNTMNTDKGIMDAANAVYQSAKLASLSFGYNYCDFQPFVDAGKYNYTSTEEGVSVTRDMSYMKLWDSIDCRLAKYLGVGADINFPSTPKVLLVGIGSIFGSVMGLIIFVLCTTFVLFVILITVRIVHIYLIAFIAIILLVYISPLAIPMVLFNYTKSSFDAWLKQLIAFSVQPIVLFAFLSLMFGIFDSILYGDNYEFLPVTKTDLVTSPKVSDNAIAKVHSNDQSVCSDQTASDCIYADKDALGYLYQKAGVVIKEIKVSGATVFAYLVLKNLSDSASVSINSDLYNIWTKDDATNLNLVDWSDSDYLKMMLALMKVTFMCYLLHALLGQVEEMSAKLTNIAGGAAAMSAAPRADPTAIAKATSIEAYKKVSGLGMKAGGFALKQTAGRALKTTGLTLKNARRAEVKSAMDKK